MSAEATCSACGQANPAGAKFCNECGAPLARARSHEVRKTVTVLFADLVGFTSLSERLDQESLRRVMDRFYEEMRGAVHAHEGTIAKFIGDAVMAVWGTPVVREDDALRAVRAAEAMRAALATLNVDLETRWGVRVGMRTGVNTGEVVVDPTKPADLLVGDTLNVAARLEQAAADGEILAGPETYRLVRDDASLQPVEPLQLKGKSRRLPAFRVVDGLRPERRRAQRLRAPLVGRDAELAALRSAFDEAVAARATRLVTVVGSPGVGKSRLAAELAQRLEPEARVLRGHCEPVSEGATFLPIAEALRMAGGVAAIPGENDQRVRDVLAVLLGSAEMAVTTEELFWAVRRRLEGLARERPLAVFLDDVHWGEPTFLDLVEHLEEWGNDGPVLLVALARPELRDARPSLCEEAGREVLALEPLPADASRALVDGLLGAADLPPALAERLLETADGNPLFLGEMVRMLVDDGVLRRDGATWVTSQADEVSVPPTIQALLAARLERLPEPERAIAQHAAVIGPLFTRDAVADLAGEPLAGAIDAHLDALRRKELIVRTTGAGDEAFRFGHALIRDAAYRPLLKESRAELHQRFADWLEARGGEQDEIVGFHLERAYGYRSELGPLDDAGRKLGRRAAARLLEAGRRALAREDLPAAIGLLGRALDVLDPDDPARMEALLDQGEALLSAGDTARGGEAVEELGLRAGAAGDERLQARATVLGGQLANMTGAGGVRDTIAVLAEAAQALARAGDAAGEAKAQHVIAGAHAVLGEVAAAEAALDRALVAARAGGDRRRVTAVLSGAPRAALWGPSPVVRASGRCLDVVRIVRMTPGNRHVEAMALRCQAVLEAMRGRAEAGRAILRNGRAALEELGLTLELHELEVFAGTVELLAGEAAAAEERLRAARDGFAALGVDAGAAQAAALLGRAVLEQERDEEAIALTEFAERHGGEDLKTSIAWRGVRAEALARRAEHAEAERLAREAVALSEPTDALADKADALMALAAVLRAAGDAGGAREAATRARELYAAKQHEVGLARADLVRAERLDRDDDLPTQSDPVRLAPGVPHDHPYLALVRGHAEDGTSCEVLALAAGVACRLVITADSTFGEVLVIEHGVVTDRERLEGDDRETLLRRFDELVVEHAPTPRQRVGAEAFRRFHLRDWDGLRELYADDFVYVDRSTMKLWEADGPDAFVAQLRDAVELTPDMRLAVDVVAEDGPVLAGFATLVATYEGGAIELRLREIIVIRDGRLARCEDFDPDDEEGFRGRLEELRAESDPVRLAPGVPHDHALIELTRRQCEGFTRADWDAYHQLFAPAYVTVDHRSVGWEGLDRDGILETAKGAKDVSPDMAETAEILALAPGLVARIQEFRGHGTGGTGLAEVVLATVSVYEDGQLIHEEFFDAGDRDAILTRFDALLVERAPTPAQRAVADFARRANACDWDGLRELLDDDFTPVLDRFRFTLWRYETADELIAHLQGLAAMAPDVRIHLEILEADGDVVAARQIWSGTHEGGQVAVAGGFVVVVRDGRCVRLEGFEPDDEAAMLARVAELRRSPPERVLDEYLSRYHARDWEGLRALYADDFTCVDRRRPALWEIDGPDDLVGQLRAAWEQRMATYARIEIVAVEGDVAAVRQTFVLDPSDAPAENAVGQVVRFRDGRIAAFDVFDPDDDEAMLARLAELADRGDPVRCAPCVPADHPHLAVMRAQCAADPGLAIEVLAVADRAVCRRVSTDATVGSLALLEDGRIAREVRVDADADDALLAAFDAFLVETAATRPLRVLAEYQRCYHARDWDGMRELFTDDLVVTDRRHPALWELEGRDDCLRQLRLASEQGIGRTRFEVLAADGDVIAARMVFSPEDAQAPVEIAAGEVLLYRDRQCAAFDVFDPDDEAGMLARFEELRGQSANLAAAAKARFGVAFEARDWDALRTLHPDDTVMVDHRPVGFGEVRGVEDVLTLRRNLADVGAKYWRGRPIALRGRRLGLFLVHLSADDPPIEADALSLIQTDADGRIWRTDVYPVEEEAAALERLEQLAEADARNEEQLAPFAARDWDAIPLTMTPDVVFEYHPGGRRFTGRDELVAYFRSAFEPSAEIRCELDRVDVTEGGVLSRRETWFGLDASSGGEWEASIDCVFVRDEAGLVRHIESFLPGDPRRDAAVERLSRAATPPA